MNIPKFAHLSSMLAVYKLYTNEEVAHGESKTFWEYTGPSGKQKVKSS
ncbi:hypothetical protein AOG2_29650 [Geobacter sp. AOG2]|nr:hypothetical protein AOG2_29650 [Geobacter sp. AOG2]